MFFKSLFQDIYLPSLFISILLIIKSFYLQIERTHSAANKMMTSISPVQPKYKTAEEAPPSIVEIKARNQFINYWSDYNIKQCHWNNFYKTRNEFLEIYCKILMNIK